jgi:hypothetical protein
VPWEGFLLLLAVALVGIWKTLGPSEIFDEGGYYLPNVLLTEQFGSVLGYANVQNHLAINSAWHPILALWGGRYLLGFGVYDLNAFLLLLYLATLAPKLAGFKKGNPDLAGWVMLLGLPFLLRNLLSAPSGDLVLMLLVYWAAALLLTDTKGNAAAEEEKWLWLAILGCAGPCIKLTGAPLALGTAYYFFRALSKRQWVQTLLPLGLVGIFFIPWMARSVMLCGFLVFPVTKLDFFDVDWKMAPEDVEPFVAGYYYLIMPDKPFFPSAASLAGWWKNVITPREAVILFAAMIAPVVWAITGLLAKKRLPHLGITPSIWTVASLATIGSVFWWSSVQEPRYGWGFLTLSLVLPIAVVFQLLSSRWLGFSYLFLIWIVVFEGFVVKKTWQEFPTVSSDLLLRPTPYPAIEFATTAAGNFRYQRPVRYTGFVPADKADKVYCWDGCIPCTSKDPAYMSRVEMRGTTIKDGYRKRK